MADMKHTIEALLLEWERELWADAREYDSELAKAGEAPWDRLWVKVDFRGRSHVVVLVKVKTCEE